MEPWFEEVAKFDVLLWGEDERAYGVVPDELRDVVASSQEALNELSKTLHEYGEWLSQRLNREPPDRPVNGRRSHRQNAVERLAPGRSTTEVRHASSRCRDHPWRVAICATLAPGAGEPRPPTFAGGR